MKEEIKKIHLKRFGKHLRELKETSGYSYRKIASRCDIESSDIKRYVDGEINPPLLSLLELAKCLGVKAKELLDYDWHGEME